MGLACAPDGSPIANARARARTVACDGTEGYVETVAGPDGRFRLSGLAPGPTQVQVRAGRFDEFYDVVIQAGQDVVLDEQSGKDCLPRDAAKVAIVSGEYDSIESIVSGMGFEFDDFCGSVESNFGARSLLGQWENLSQYDVLFINCGTTISIDGPDGRVMIENLRRFAAEGGAVYVSDLAAYVVEAAWPAAVDFAAEPWDDWGGAVPAVSPCCTCVNCPPECGVTMDRSPEQCLGFVRGIDEGWECEHAGAMIGFGPPGVRHARVDSPALQQFIGAASQDVHYPDSDWIQIRGVANGVDVLVSDGEPLMVSFPVGDRGGRVTYTTFHNHDQGAATIERMLQGLIFQL